MDGHNGVEESGIHPSPLRNQKKHGRFFHAVSASEDVDPGDYVIRKLQLESIDYLWYKDRKYPKGGTLQKQGTS
ncbi:hypothetical protein IFM46972_02437 [Aspergillus udagawae]|uniref:Uncharacterized protein n=1 Tax=Aspergillus udagawae TaxID=91492 RepID=A0A8H3RJD0_9EURO|nr:hypothetical protein IFM46972_02437 [Aspergillus udagawae]